MCYCMCRVSYAICFTCHVVCHVCVSCVVCHVLRVMCHVSRVTFHVWCAILLLLYTLKFAVFRLPRVVCHVICRVQAGGFAMKPRGKRNESIAPAGPAFSNFGEIRTPMVTSQNHLTIRATTRAVPCVHPSPTRHPASDIRQPHPRYGADYT